MTANVFSLNEISSGVAMPLLQRASQDSRSAENAVLNEIEKEDVKLNFVYLEQSHDGM